MKPLGPTIASSLALAACDILACGERLVRVFVESSELLFKCLGNLIEGFLGHHLNVFHCDTSDIHRMIPLERQSRLAVKNSTAEHKSRQRESSNRQNRPHHLFSIFPSDFTKRAYACF